ncbi:MAG: heavy metal-responsive transcriptional regulator [Salinisphaeraceae bacterium]|nr:heavy metal-responsive transcriptional regulator [Salinisphaeraceae bacterium]
MSLSIGQLASKAHTTVETIRYYERCGVIPEPPRTSSGHRRYPANATQRLHFVKRAKTLGFTLDEIMTLLELNDGGGDRAQVKSTAQDKLAELDARIRHLRRMRSALAKLERQCSGTGPVAGCPIIEALSDDRSGFFNSAESPLDS